MAKRSNIRAKKPAKARSESPVSDVSEEACVSDSEDAPSLRSDALDEQSDDSADKAETRKKRQRGAPSPKQKPASARSPKKGASEKKTRARKKRKVDEDADEDEGDSDVVELKGGQKVVGKVVEAPTTGWGAYAYFLEAPVCD